MERRDTVDLANLGTRLREVRNGLGLSLGSVAQGTGLSRAFISMLENGKTDISVGRLVKMLTFYGIRIDDALGRDGSSADPMVTSPTARRELNARLEGMRLYLLVPTTRSRRMMPLLVEYDSEANMSDFARHEGEEFVHVLEGSIVLEMEDGREFKLGPGDSAYYSSELGHRFRAGVEGAVAFGVANPPTL